MRSSKVMSASSFWMSTFQPESLAVRRAFWPFLPMARESWSASTMTLTVFSASSTSQAQELGRREGVGHEGLDVGAPLDDVDLFAGEFADDVLDALSAQADAGADGVDLVVVGMDGDFGAEAGFAGDALDFDGAVGDFGDFEFEEPLDEVGIGAGEDDLGALGQRIDPPR
jgi:hypothetical protein